MLRLLSTHRRSIKPVGVITSSGVDGVRYCYHVFAGHWAYTAR